jgi:hypothetical protein
VSFTASAIKSAPVDDDRRDAFLADGEISAPDHDMSLKFESNLSDMAALPLCLLRRMLARPID